MSRVTILDKLQNYWSLQDEVSRIHILLCATKTIHDPYGYGDADYTVRSFVDLFCFRDWKNAGHFLGINDFLDVMEYEKLKDNAKQNVEDFINYIELCYTLFKLSERLIDSSAKYKYYQEFITLKTIMQDGLERYNHCAYYDEKNELILVIEKDAAVTSVVEIEEDTEIAIDIIQYNHHTLKGDSKKKKGILIKLGNELEACKKKLTSINNALATDIFMMLNNLDIRHNNVKEGSKNYQRNVAEMSPDELEYWYDELYQMILLAKLELDNAERAKKVTELKASFT